MLLFGLIIPLPDARAVMEVGGNGAGMGRARDIRLGRAMMAPRMSMSDIASAGTGIVSVSVSMGIVKGVGGAIPCVGVVLGMGMGMAHRMGLVTEMVIAMVTEMRMRRGGAVATRRAVVRLVLGREQVVGLEAQVEAQEAAGSLLSIDECKCPTAWL